jgi:DNA-directed RNA polymerase subunit beta
METIKTKDFSKSEERLPIPYLLSVQKDSWESFINEELKELFSEVSPIRDHTGKKFELWFEDFRFEKSKYKSDLEAKKNNASYEVPLKVKVKLVNLKTKETKYQEVFLTDFPVLTERGTFIINGVERIVISQLIRSPGAFFTSTTNSKGEELFGAKIIPNRGSWLEFGTSSSGVISVKVDRKRKIPVTTLLKAFGAKTNDEIKDLFKKVDKGEVKFIEKTLAQDSTKDQAEAMVEVYKHIRPGDMASPDTAKELLDNMFFNFERYDLSKVGRWKMRRRLEELKDKKNDKITKDDRVLKLDDVVFVIREIIRLNNDPKAEPDQIDHLGNRRVRTLGEFLKNRLRVGLMRMERIIKNKMSTAETGTVKPIQLINPRPFMGVVKQFFSSSQFSQFMDNENPLAELEHKRRLSATGPGGLTRERAGFEVRDVQPSHYGRVCPIQTPEGPNIGLVNHLSTYAKINEFGFIETPYCKVKNGKVTSEIEYLLAFEEEKYNIAHGGVELDEKGSIVDPKVEARNRGEPKEVEREKIDFIDVSSGQSISVATSLIPFLQNDDANRALMGSNMQRQSVPLINPGMPLVMTGLEQKVAVDSGQVIVAKESGTVEEVDGKHVKVKDSKGKTKEYELRRFVRTNQYTCFHQRARVKKGQKVKKGDLLADGGSIDRGRLALGQNLLVAFMPFKGESFEDAIVISDRLVKEDLYTSIHVEDFTCDVRETKLGPEITTYDIPNVGEDKLKDLDEEGVIRVGAEVGPNDILVGKISPKGKESLTAEERLLGAIFGEKAKEVKDTSLRMEHGKRGRVVRVKIFEREESDLDPGVIKRIKVEVAQLRKVKAGDKLAGRHGNKGIVSKILPAEEMPFLEDGTPVDIILSPLSVVSRMNIGQILETHLGLAASKLGYHAITPALTGANKEDIRRELEEAGFPGDGKLDLYDGQTGKPYPRKITVGITYMMKLIHMVEDKVHMRAIGPYSLITQQPLGGKAQFGGQRFGEMEVWALEGHGAAHSLQEMLTIKSDDVPGRAATYEAILKGEEISTPNLPASFNLLVNEMKSLGLSLIINPKGKKKK